MTQHESMREEVMTAIKHGQMMKRLRENEDFKAYMDLRDNIAKSLVSNCSGKDELTEKRIIEQMKAYSVELNVQEGLLQSGELAIEELAQLNNESTTEV